MRNQLFTFVFLMHMDRNIMFGINLPLNKQPVCVRDGKQVPPFHLCLLLPLASSSALLCQFPLRTLLPLPSFPSHLRARRARVPHQSGTHYTHTHTHAYTHTHTSTHAYMGTCIHTWRCGTGGVSIRRVVGALRPSRGAAAAAAAVCIVCMHVLLCL